MAEHKDKIKGGLADKKKPSNFDAKSLKQGKKVESEHTEDKSIAQEIAMDHLTEDKQYYKKLKEVEKKDMIEITADGKQEIVEGNEPLKLKKKWKDLKKGLNNLDSIMDLAAAQQPEEQPQPEEGEEQMDPEAMDQEQPMDDEAVENTSPEDDESTQPEMEEGDESMDDEIPEDDEQSEEQPEEGGGDEDSEQKIIQALKDEGYGDPEIAYIVHGHHSPTYDESKEAKAHATYAMADVDTDNAKKQGEMDLQTKQKQMELEHQHAMRMKDLEFQHAQMQSPDPETEKNHKKRMLDLEYDNAKAASPDGSDKEHQKRMMDLEFQNASAGAPDPEIAKQMQAMDLEERKLALEQRKAEMKLELEFKKKEHDMKLKLMEENMKMKAKQQSEHGKLKHSMKMQDAKSPKKPLKKSADDEFESELDDE